MLLRSVVDLHPRAKHRPEEAGGVIQTGERFITLRRGRKRSVEDLGVRQVRRKLHRRQRDHLYARIRQLAPDEVRQLALDLVCDAPLPLRISHEARWLRRSMARGLRWRR